MTAKVRAARKSLAAELALALPATVTVLLAMFLVEELTHQRALFASLAASAFLIYHDPAHLMNTVRAMVTSYLAATALGVGAAWLLAPGYAAAAAALTLAICLLIATRSVHPPALAVALSFGFSAQQEETVILFALSVVVVALLIAVQVAVRWAFARLGHHRHRHPAAGRTQTPTTKSADETAISA